MTEHASSASIDPADDSSMPQRAIHKCRRRGFSEFEIQDDTDQWVPCLNWGDINQQASPDATRVLVRIEEMMRSDTWFRPNRQIPIWVATGIVLLFVTMILIVTSSAWGFAVVPLTGVVGSVIALPLILRYQNNARRRMAPIAAAYALREGFCAGCGYALSGLQADEARLLHCPECSGAWRADSVGTSAEAMRTDLPPVQLPGGLRSPVMIRLLGLAAKKGEDDRGNPLAFVRTTLDYERACARDPERRRRLNSARRAMRRPTLHYRVLVAVLALGLVAWPWASGVARGALAAGRIDWIMVLIFVWAIPSGILGILMGDTGIKPARIRDEMLKHRMCPACASDLDGPTDEFGYRKCPKCRAQWRHVIGADEEKWYARTGF